MNGPWEDYKPQPAVNGAGPWEDYAPAARNKEQASEGLAPIPAPATPPQTERPVSPAPQSQASNPQPPAQQVVQPTEQPDEGGVLASVGDALYPSSVVRGFQRGQQGFNVLRGQLGIQDAAETAGNVAEAEQTILANPPSDSQVQGLKELQALQANENLSWGNKALGTLGWIGRNPSAAGALLGESLGQSTVSLLAGLGGGAVGTAAGPAGTVGGFAAGTFAGSLATEYSNSLMSFLEKEGFETSDPKQLESALANPEVMAKARDYSLKRGVPIAAFDSLTSLLGARGAGRAIVEAGERAAGGTIKGATTRLLSEAATQTVLEAAGGAAGEATAGFLSEGRVDPVDTTLEFFLEFGPGAVDASAAVAIERFNARRGAAANAEDIDRFYEEEESGGIPDPVIGWQGAVAAGRENFTIVNLDGTPIGDEGIVTTRSGSTTEAALGSVDSNQSAMVALPDELVTADVSEFENGRLFSTEEMNAQTPALREEMLAINGLQNPIARAAEYSNLVLTTGLRIQPRQHGWAPNLTPEDVQRYRVAPTGADLSKSGAVVADTSSGEEIYDPVPKAGRGPGVPVYDMQKLRELVEPGQFIPSRDALLNIVSDKDQIQALIDDGSIIVKDPKMVGNIDAIAEEIRTFRALQDGTVTTRMPRKIFFMPDARLTDVQYPFTLVVNSAQDGEDILAAAAFNLDSPSREVVDTLNTFVPRKKLVPPEAFTKQIQELEEGGVHLILGRDYRFEDDRIGKAEKLIKFLNKKFGIKDKIVLVVGRDGDNEAAASGLIFSYSEVARDLFAGLGLRSLGYYNSLGPNLHIIAMSAELDTEAFYNTLMHEYGHFLAATAFARAPQKVRAALGGAYKRFVQNASSSDVGHYKRRRQADPGRFYNIEGNPKYAFSFDEWFADQVARWAQTDRRPLGILGQFFKRLAKQILYAFKQFRKQYEGESFKAEPEMAAWLNSLYDGKIEVNWSDAQRAAFELETRKRNQQAIGDSGKAMQAESANVYSVLDRFVNTPDMAKQIKSPQLKADIDRYNWFYKYGLSIRQLAMRNPHINALQSYVQNIELAQLETNTILEAAEARMQQWRALGDEAGPLTDFLFDLTNMVYLSKDEEAKQVRRWPTREEFIALAQKHKLSRTALEVYQGIRSDFQNVIERQHQLSLEAAQALDDPRASQLAIRQAEELRKSALAAPYFPMMRYGNWTLTVRNAAGNVVHFETFETRKQQKRAAAMAEREFDENHKVTMATLPDELTPFVGTPSWLLDKLFEMPGMNKQQKDWLEQLKYQLAPARSFQKRFLRRAGRSGYSMDGMRTYASYFFQHGRQFSRVKYEPWLRGAIDNLRKSYKKEGDQTKRTRMADYLEDHLKEFLNPGRDWSMLRSIAAIWHLGFVPASAMINMTQTFVATAPFLSTKFGDIKAFNALRKSAQDLSSYYRRGTYKAQTDAELRALGQAIEEGLITESMAAELAAITSGGPFSFGGNALQRGWLEFSSKAMWMFQMVEQWNRRVSFRAGWKLGLENPDAPFVKQILKTRYLEVQDLTAKGWTEAEAAAYLVGKETTITTHYDYSKAARPRFMRGRKGVLFTFYMFTQNTLFMLWNNPDMLVRYMLMMTLMAGPMGLLPEDVEEIIEGIAKRFFGKDFDIERSVRKLIVDILGDDPALPPDLLLHGAGRYSFGMKPMMDSAGANWFPSIDFSRNVALNRIIPLAPTKLLDPTTEYKQALVDTTQDLAGAGFGPGLALYKALGATDLEWHDLKRWETSMPRALKSVTRGTRYALEGGERDRNYFTTVPYDVNDPEHVAEILSVMAGLTPTKQAQFWDRQSAEFEVSNFHKTRRSLLLLDAYRTRYIHKDMDGYKEVLARIKKYNASVPAKKMRITGKTLQESRKRRQEVIKKKMRGENPYLSKGAQQEVDRLYPEVTRTPVSRVK
jgi:hypothetical protein